MCFISCMSRPSGWFDPHEGIFMISEISSTLPAPGSIGYFWSIVHLASAPRIDHWGAEFLPVTVRTSFSTRFKFCDRTGLSDLLRLSLRSLSARAILRGLTLEINGDRLVWVGYGRSEVSLMFLFTEASNISPVQQASHYFPLNFLWLPSKLSFVLSTLGDRNY